MHKEIQSLLLPKEAIKDPSMLCCGVMFRLWSKSHFWCMFLSAESASGHMAAYCGLGSVSIPMTR